MMRSFRQTSLLKCRRALYLSYQQHQLLSTTSRDRPFNTVILFVPQQEAWVVERFGKYHATLNPGFNILIPVIDSIKYVQVLKEIAIEVPEQHAITSDNVTLKIDGVLYVKVTDPYKTSYGVEDPEFAITQLAQTTMRSEIGKIPLDTVFKERDALNIYIVETLNKAADAWGINCLRYEIKNIELPKKVQEAMQMQVEAERKKRAAILESEGIKEADINVAQGKKQARILNSEANKLEQINQAQGEAQAILAKASAQATSVEVIAAALRQKNGMNAVSMKIAEQYVAAFGNLAKKGNTVLLPNSTGDISSMVTQAMAIYNNISNNKQLQASEVDGELDDATVDEINVLKDNAMKGTDLDSITKDTALTDKDSKSKS
ncbi:stomatin-like protein stl-1 [Ruditapes philippinarum]|uniref:stomatin-like protein stl-1 n=1 Tax=Ruditapes philippinarum TaxID=129788 RepID=UPI00295C2317|nr:stomatin-like protein stl-1 [Ruditapes philippinarum]